MWANKLIKWLEIVYTVTPIKISPNDQLENIAESKDQFRKKREREREREIKYMSFSRAQWKRPQSCDRSYKDHWSLNTDHDIKPKLLQARGQARGRGVRECGANCLAMQSMFKRSRPGFEYNARPEFFFFPSIFFLLIMPCSQTRKILTDSVEKEIKKPKT